MNNINYELSINYNYDSEQDKVVETRCVKRILEDKCTQYLKADFKVLDRSSVPNNIYESAKSGDLVSFELPLENEKIDMIMEEQYDLFKHIKEYSETNS